MKDSRVLQDLLERSLDVVKQRIDDGTTDARTEVKQQKLLEKELLRVRAQLQASQKVIFLRNSRTVFSLFFRPSTYNYVFLSYKTYRISANQRSQ